MPGLPRCGFNSSNHITALAVSEVQEQGARLEKAAANADLTALAAYYKEHPPSPPVKLDPYPNTILGLEMARKDCRFEMIKIVKEVSI